MIPGHLYLKLELSNGMSMKRRREGKGDFCLVVFCLFCEMILLFFILPAYKLDSKFKY